MGSITTDTDLFQEALNLTSETTEAITTKETAVLDGHNRDNTYSKLVKLLNRQIKYVREDASFAADKTARVALKATEVYDRELAEQTFATSKIKLQFQSQTMELFLAKLKLFEALDSLQLLEVENEIITKELRQRELRLACLDKQLLHSTRDCSSKEAHILALEQQLSNLRELHATTQEQAVAKEQAFQAQQAQLESLEAEKHALQLELAKAQAARDEIHRQKEELQNSLSVANERARELQGRANASEELAKANSALLGNELKCVGENSRAATVQAEEANRRIRSLEEELHKTQQLLQERTHKDGLSEQQTIAALESHLKTLQQQVTVKDQKIAMLEEQCKHDPVSSKVVSAVQLVTSIVSDLEVSTDDCAIDKKPEPADPTQGAEQAKDILVTQEENTSKCRVLGKDRADNDPLQGQQASPAGSSRPQRNRHPAGAWWQGTTGDSSAKSPSSQKKSPVATSAEKRKHAKQGQRKGRKAKASPAEQNSKQQPKIRKNTKAGQKQRGGSEQTANDASQPNVIEGTGDATLVAERSPGKADPASPSHLEKESGRIDDQQPASLGKETDNLINDELAQPAVASVSQRGDAPSADAGAGHQASAQTSDKHSPGPDSCQEHAVKPGKGKRQAPQRDGTAKKHEEETVEPARKRSMRVRSRKNEAGKQETTEIPDVPEPAINASKENASAAPSGAKQPSTTQQPLRMQSKPLQALNQRVVEAAEAMHQASQANAATVANAQSGKPNKRRLTGGNTFAAPSFDLLWMGGLQAPKLASKSQPVLPQGSKRPRP